MEKATNRRGALLSLAKATAGVAALGVACSVSQCTTPAHSAAIVTDRSAWDAAMSSYMASAEVSNRYHNEVYEPAKAAFDEAVAAVPHVTFPPRHGRAVSTADEWEVRSARSGLKSVCYVEQCAWEDHQARIALVDAADARDAKIAQIHERSGLAHAHDESERLSEVSYADYVALLSVPLNSATLLLEKYQFMQAQGGIDGWEDEIGADIARLAAREA